MTIQDIYNIYTIIQEKSINKASQRLYISQPALSKCVKRVEEEYDIRLFERAKGSTIEITAEGELFAEMAEIVLRDIKQFEEKLARQRSRNDNNIVFAAALHRASSISGYVTRWIYEKAPAYLMEIRTYPSKELLSVLKAGIVDIVLVTGYKPDPELYGKTVTESYPLIYLRNGSDAGKKSRKDPVRPFPVLAIEDLKGETLITAPTGTGSRRQLEKILSCSAVKLPLREESNFYLRTAMSDAGQCTCILISDVLMDTLEIDYSRLYCLPEKQSLKSVVTMVCRREWKDDPRFLLLYNILYSYYNR